MQVHAALLRAAVESLLESYAASISRACIAWMAAGRRAIAAGVCVLARVVVSLIILGPVGRLMVRVGAACGHSSHVELAEGWGEVLTRCRSPHVKRPGLLIGCPVCLLFPVVVILLVVSA